MAASQSAAKALHADERSVRLHRFSVDEYERLIADGLLGVNNRVELIAGLVVDQMTRNPSHDVALSLLDEALTALLPPGTIRRIQSALRLKDSVPEPDLVVVPGPARRYTSSHPTPSDVELVVEISEASLAFDRGEKWILYAGARIPVYWIVNLTDRRVEVYTQPRGGKSPTYRHSEEFGPDDAVPLIVGGQPVGTIAVADLLP